MKEAREVKELRGKILGMEMELNILFRDLERLKQELLCNTVLQEKIYENLAFLKESNAAVSLSEYKKIQQQRNLVDMRVVYYVTKIQPLEQLIDRKEIRIEEEMVVFEKIYRMQFKNNVLEFPYDRRKKA